MSDPITSDDSKDIANRFHRLINPDKGTEGLSLPEGESLSSDSNQSHVKENSGTNQLESSSPKIEEIETPEQPEDDHVTEPVVEIFKEYPINDTLVKNERQSISQNIVEEQANRSVPAIDEYGMPIPLKRNHVTQPYSANESIPNPRTSNPTFTTRSIVQSQQHSGFQNYQKKIKGTTPRSNKTRSSISIKQGMGCVLRMFILATIAGIVLLLVGGSIVLYEYSKIVATLPSVSDLQQRASTFETTRIFDRNGGLLYEILDPNAGRRTFITLDKISPYLIAATIATEDKSFYSHPGFDWTAILRAFWQNFQGGGTVSGASTITQQLARNLLMSPEERYEQSYIRKVREALLAAEITRRYSKDQILELYLNEFYYGNIAYGVEAAAETYFQTTANNLDLSQASFLAGLPQAPSVYDVYNNREAARNRQQQVLTLMFEASAEQGCIYVSNSPERVCIDAQTAVDAYVALENYEFQPPDVNIRYPHWVNYVRSILETQFDAQTIYHSGFSVYTTIDPVLQDQAEAVVKEQVDTLSIYNANNGALVAIRPNSGEILAMVGSADFYNDDIDGQVNMATSPTRQPGSSIKPFTYLAAFEKGWTPATLIWDVPSEFPPSGIPDDPSPPYKPENYDSKFHGPVTVRAALANSYNIPAVKTLDYVGIYDNPDTMNRDGLLAMAEKMGIFLLTRPDYGLSLTLGGGEVSLLEMTGAYSVIANGGNRVPPVAISRILDHNGNIVYEYQVPSGDQVIRPEHAFLISSILSDNEARSPMFGSNSVLNLPFPAAAKTGTSNDFRDNWTLGYTPDMTVGVWVGNADYSEMENITGLTGAAPIWSKFMQFAVDKYSGGSSSPFYKPSGIVDRVICSVSGTEPSQWCPSQRSEYFASDQLPLPSSDDLWTKVVFHTWTGLRASNNCQDFTKDEYALNVTDSWAIGWLQNSPEGKAWVQEMGFDEPIKFTPPRACDANDPQPTIEITVPGEGQTITTSPLVISGRVDVSADFKDFRVEYGTGGDPEDWNELFVSDQPISQVGEIYSWEMHSLPPGLITLKITMENIRGGYAERRIHLNVQIATPTPTVTPTATPTPTFTPTQVPSLTPTITPSITPTPGVTPNPTITQPPSFSKP